MSSHQLVCGAVQRKAGYSTRHSSKNQARPRYQRLTSPVRSSARHRPLEIQSATCLHSWQWTPARLGTAVSIWAGKETEKTRHRSSQGPAVTTKATQVRSRVAGSSSCTEPTYQPNQAEPRTVLGILALVQSCCECFLHTKRANHPINKENF
jgi:hypothetical protein